MVRRALIVRRLPRVERVRLFETRARLHPTGSDETIVRVITETARRGGVVVVPSFAVGRTQELIWTIRKLEEEGRLPPIPVFIDTPGRAALSAVLSAVRTSTFGSRASAWPP